MSTPQRAPPPPAASGQKQIGTPKSQVEDSPVFNYINNLSPIKPVKSLHITQSFQSLSFPPVPSIFSSPHVNTQKVSKFILRPHPSHAPTSGNEDAIQQCSEAFDFPKGMDGNSVGTNYISTCPSSSDPTNLSANEHLIQDNMLSLSLQYNCGSPNHKTLPFYDVKSHAKLDASSAVLIDTVPNDLEESRNLDYDLDTGCVRHTEDDIDVPECEWKAMISEDAKNLLVFDSCTEAEAYNGHSEVLDQDSNLALVVSNFSEGDIHIPQGTQAEDLLGNLDKEVEKQIISGFTGTSFPTEDGHQANTGIETMDPLADGCVFPGNKVEFKLQRGMLRRCLVFEMPGANRENVSSGLSEISSSLSCNVSYDEQQVNSQKAGSSPPSRLLPGIGLHLNSLASTSKDRIFRRDGFPCEGHLSTQISVPQLLSVSQNGQVPEVSSLDDNHCPTSEDLALVVRETSVEPEIIKSEELNSNSPKKKKRKIESNNESGSCKRCNCKKSKCLKLYCECFAAGVYCVEPCSCQDCFNKPLHEDTVLATRKQIESRNPLAFAPKVIRTSEPALDVGEETNKTPASARHKRGCNCKKSNCLKKYCECYQGGAGCSISCRCEGCKNKFGTKSGKLPVSTELIVHGDEEMDHSIKDGRKPDNRPSTTSKIDQQQNPETVTPITPSFTNLRPSAKPPCPSTGKPPRSTVLVIGSSPRLNAFKTLKRSETTPCQSETVHHSHPAPIDETPDILKGGVANVGIKVSSPSRKRVSPPHGDTRVSPHHKGSRKLILKSIPSFPSLATEVNSDDCPTILSRELLISSPVNDDVTV